MISLNRTERGRTLVRLGFAGIAVTAACTICVPATTFADEGGVSFWLPGTYGSLAAEFQQPGWSLSISDYYARMSAGSAVSEAREIEIGRFPIGLSATVNANFNGNTEMLLVEPTYVFATPFFGGQPSVGMSGFLGRDSGSLMGTLSGTLTTGGATVPFARSDNISESVSGVGDLYPLFSLRWSWGVNSLMTYVTGDIPVGAYDAARLANLGLGHGAIDIGSAYSYYNSESGQELSGTLGFTYNLINPSTQYQSGIDLHFDLGASHFFTEDFQAGIVGYAYREVGCDSGSGDRLGCFQAQVLGIGPQIGFIFPVGRMEGYLNLKAYMEFAAENRPEGWNAWITFVLSPTAPGTSSKPITTK